MIITCHSAIQSFFFEEIRLRNINDNYSNCLQKIEGETKTIKCSVGKNSMYLNILKIYFSPCLLLFDILNMIGIKSS